jgi:hypothetical protein
LERALRIAEARKVAPGALFEAHFALARERWPSDRAAALTLATAAREDCLALENQRGCAKQVNDWIRSASPGSVKRAGRDMASSRGTGR